MEITNRPDEGFKGIWRAEWINEDIVELYRVVGIRHSEVSSLQKIEIIDTYPYGRCLLLDDKMQSSELDEYVYHESLVHPALVTHGSPRRVMIIGGGEGATAREVARWRSVEEILMVEIDQRVIEASRLHLPAMSSGVFDDARLRLLIEDGREALRELPEKYLDVLIIDVTDPLEGGPSYLLYTKQFYELARSRLSRSGVLATHATSPVHNEPSYSSIKKTLESVFKNVSTLSAYVKSFSSLWGFVVASDARDCGGLKEEEVERELREAGVAGLRFYSGAMHRAMLTLAAHVDSVIKDEGRIILDEAPIFIK